MRKKEEDNEREKKVKNSGMRSRTNREKETQ